MSEALNYVALFTIRSRVLSPGARCHFVPGTDEDAAPCIRNRPGDFILSPHFATGGLIQNEGLC